MARKKHIPYIVGDRVGIVTARNDTHGPTAWINGTISGVGGAGRYRRYSVSPDNTWLRVVATVCSLIGRAAKQPHRWKRCDLVDRRAGAEATLAELLDQLMNLGE